PQGKLERLGRWLRRRKELGYPALGAVAVVFVSVLVVLWRSAKPGPAEGLPPDLRLVPPHPARFPPLPMADLWAGHEANDLNKQLPLGELFGLRKLDDAGALLADGVGIHPREVERGTFVILKYAEELFFLGGDGERAPEDVVAMIFATSRPYS